MNGFLRSSCTTRTTLFLTFVLSAIPLRADDWPQFRGPNRDGVWRETGILQTIPSRGLHVRWRARISYGYSGPVVAQGRVFVTDRQRNPEMERVLCFDEITGKPLWMHSYPCDYDTMEYGNGPRASPTVHDGKVYALGTKGYLVCLDAASGNVIWKKDLVKEYSARPPQYGASVAPLVEGDLLIVSAGGRPDATFIAFDRNTGLERWKALPDRPAYSAPIAITAGGCRQVIAWTADTISSLEPATGKILWQVPYKATFDPAQAVAAPVLHNNLLLCLAAWNSGSIMLKLNADKPAASVLWKTRSLPTTTFTTPIFQDERHFYEIAGDGRLCCFDALTGQEVWGTRAPTNRKFGTGHLTPNGDRVFLFNQTGHLFLTRLTPQGYQELGRCPLVEPTAGFRAGNAVAWAHPAYANKHVFARNDRELVCASLAAEQYIAANAPAPPRAVDSLPLPGAAGPDESLALSVAISPDGKSLALGSGWGSVKLLELPTGKELPSPRPFNDWVCSVAFSPDGKILASAGGSEFINARNGNKTSAELKLWDITTKTEVGKLTGHTSKVFTCAFSPDGQTLATGSADKTVRLWDLATLKERAVLMGHTDGISSVAFFRDGKTIASAGWDRTIRLWDSSTGNNLATLNGHEEEILSLAISPDGRTIATGSADWTVRLWDVATLKEQAILKSHHGAIYCVAFSSDGKTLATASGDETIKLWDIPSKTERTTLYGHTSGVTSLAFAPGDKTLASAAMDDPARLWDLTSGN